MLGCTRAVFRNTNIMGPLNASLPNVSGFYGTLLENRMWWTACTALPATCDIIFHTQTPTIIIVLTKIQNVYPQLLRWLTKTQTDTIACRRRAGCQRDDGATEPATAEDGQWDVDLC
jgi:hypothetical protein